MTVRVMQTIEDYRGARRELDRRALSVYRRSWFTQLRLTLGIGPPRIGDLRKSWDILKTAEFLEQRVPRDQPILDLGAHTSELILVLHKMGFTKLHGIDLDPRVTSAPFREHIRYVVGDFLHSPFPDASFAAITAISAIEHGHNAAALFREVSRVLRPGGYFIGSTDYWPQKVDTTGVTIFDMTWTIFSTDELRALFQGAEAHGLRLAGDARYEGGQPLVHVLGRWYTFAWFLLQKVA